MSKKTDVIYARVEGETAEKLEALHARTRIPKAEFIREGLKLALAKYEKLQEGGKFP